MLLLCRLFVKSFIFFVVGAVVGWFCPKNLFFCPRIPFLLLFFHHPKKSFVVVVVVVVVVVRVRALRCVFVVGED